MVGLPADVVLRRQMRRASGGDMDYLVIRLLSHDIDWGSYHEIMDEWTLDELVDANRASDIADRLRELNSKAK